MKAWKEELRSSKVGGSQLKDVRLGSHSLKEEMKKKGRNPRCSQEIKESRCKILWYMWQVGEGKGKRGEGRPKVKR